MRRYVLLLAFWTVTLVWAGPGRAQTATPSGPPDVLVIVYQRPGLGDQVNLTYAHTVPHAQAQRDLQALAQAAGWTVEGAKITDGLPPVQGRMGAMTSTSFVVAHAIDDSSRTFPLEALVTAFRPYKRLALVFFVASGFQFQGLRQFADNNVRVTMEQRGSAYTYQIQILNAGSGRLHLPQPVSTQTAPPNAARRSPLALLLGILLAAGAAGAVVYLAAARLTTPETPEVEEKRLEPKDK